MAAPLVPIAGSALIRVGGGMALRRVSMGNALTGIGTGFRLMDFVEDQEGNVYQVVPDPMPGRASRTDSIPVPKSKTKRKRKVSAYQREFGKQLKKLKKKHPRTKISQLMKRAHIATRKVRK
jgi:hypothetical protein